MVNRLFGICYQLLLKGKIPARELAERYEVSVRTIYRDVEMLSMAGIPVYASKGRGGGISLLDSCVLDKMFVTQEEKQQILSALESLQEVEPSAQSGKLLQRLADFFQTPSSNWVSVDLSDWSGRREELFCLLKTAILSHQVLEFDYYGKDAKAEHRVVEPVKLWFKGYTWYLRAWCRSRNAMRTFKVLRIRHPQCRQEVFLPRRDEEEKTLSMEAGPVNEPVGLTLRIDGSQAFRVFDLFEEEEISREKDGSFLIRTAFPIDSWVYGMILSYCPYVQVLEPEWIREEVRGILARSLERM